METCSRDFFGHHIQCYLTLSELRAGDVQKSVSCLSLPQGFSPLFHRPRVFIAETWEATATLSMAKMLPYSFSTYFNEKTQHKLMVMPMGVAPLR